MNYQCQRVRSQRTRVLLGACISRTCGISMSCICIYSGNTNRAVLSRPPRGGGFTRTHTRQVPHGARHEWSLRDMQWPACSPGPGTSVSADSGLPSVKRSWSLTSEILPWGGDTCPTDGCGHSLCGGDCSSTESLNLFLEGEIGTKLWARGPLVSRADTKRNSIAPLWLKSIRGFDLVPFFPASWCLRSCRAGGATVSRGSSPWQHSPACHREHRLWPTGPPFSVPPASMAAEGGRLSFWAVSHPVEVPRLHASATALSSSQLQAR